MVNISKKVINIKVWKDFFKALFNFLLILIYTALQYFVSWAGTSGVVWLICWLFRITFSFEVATGIWLALTLIGVFINYYSNLYKNK